MPSIYKTHSRVREKRKPVIHASTVSWIRIWRFLLNSSEHLRTIRSRHPWQYTILDQIERESKTTSFLCYLPKSSVGLGRNICLSPCTPSIATTAQRSRSLEHLRQLFQRRRLSRRSSPAISRKRFSPFPYCQYFNGSFRNTTERRWTVKP